MEGFNPVASGLTHSESKTYKEILRLANSGKIIKNKELVAALKISRFSVHQNVTSLIRKGLVERYDSFFYKPTNPKKGK